jgi:hypothetical protein
LPEGLAAPPKGAGVRVVSWEHLGYGGGRPVAGIFSAYRSQRVRASLDDGKPPAGRPDPAKPYFADLGGGVSCLVPLALYADEQGTLPKVEAPAQPGRPGRLSA